jgi:3-oxoacyl-[acyl-carrier protein] reductase
MAKLLSGKTALVTGAARGIGKVIVETLAAQGCNIAFTDLRKTESAEQTEANIAALGVKVQFFEANAASFEDGLILRMSEEQWRQVIDINLNSAFFHTKHAMKYMMKQRSGSIINITSVVGVGGNAGQANYAASKAGMIGLTKSVAKELGSRNIRCNAVAPGFIQTEMTANLPEKEVEAWKNKIPLQRPGTAADVANICLFLASDLSSYMTGQVLLADGGMLM